MKNLLMIVPFFPPMAGGGVYRPLGFVKYLTRFNWNATVLAPAGHAFWITDDSLLDEIPQACRVHRTATMSGQYVLSLLRGGRGRRRRPQTRSTRGFRLLRRAGASFLVPDTYIGWYPFAVGTGRKILRAQRFDAIYSTSPPETSHLIADSLQRYAGIPWVADFRDPWMNLHLFPPPTPVHARIHRRMEENVCRRAHVVVTDRWHAELLQRAYPGMKSLRIIPNGFDQDEFDGLSRVAPPADRFRVLHAGMLTQKRSAVPFLRALDIFMRRRPECRERCEALFLGPREDEGEQEVARLGLGDVVEFRDTVSHEQSLQLERCSHILLLIKHLNPEYRGIVPGKLYEYIGAQRPILALVPDGEARALVEELRRGEVAPQDDPPGIADRIEAMYDKYAQGRLDTDYDLEPVTRFTRERLAGDLAAYLDETLENQRD